MALLHGIWNEKMALGIKEIDEHHKTLLRLVLETKEVVSHGGDPLAVKRIIESLRSYSMYHFKTEERHMLTMGYKGLKDHRLLHKDFIHRIESLALDFGNNSVQINIQLLQFLSNWFVEHILKEDRKFVSEEEG